jgi:hypothetical protein
LDGARDIPLILRLAMQAPNVRECQIPKVVVVGHVDMPTDERKGAVFVQKREGCCNRIHYLAFLSYHHQPSSPSFGPKVLRTQNFGSAVASGMSHDRCTMTEELPVSVFAFIEWPTKCMKARTTWCHDYKTVLGPTYSTPDCGLPIHIGAAPAN